jgi:hypothetical protein
MEVLDPGPAHYPNNGLCRSVEYLKTIRKKDVLYFDVSVSLFADAVHKKYATRVEKTFQGYV